MSIAYYAADETSDTPLSARYEYQLLAQDGPSVVVATLSEYCDKDGHLGDSAAKQLFDKIWIAAKSDRSSELVLDASGVLSTTSRFQQELRFLNRHLRLQGRAIRLSNTGPANQTRLSCPIKREH